MDNWAIDVDFQDADSVRLSSDVNDAAILECYLNHPDPRTLAYPSFELFARHQQQD